MSHIVEIKTEIKDAAAVFAACERLRLPRPVHGTYRLFTQTATGLGVQLPDWKFLVVCELTSGTVKYDNFKGRWGDPCHLDALLQCYAVEKAKFEARRQGHCVTEQLLDDGSVKVTVQVGAAA